MKNQFDYTPKEMGELAEVFRLLGERGSPSVRYMAGLVQQFKERPILCGVPNGAYRLQIRTPNGERRTTTKRAYIYFLATGKVATFGPCTCKNAGCVNPCHQTVISTYSEEEGLVHAPAFGFTESKQK